jgi:hypothetical protein
MLFRSEYGSAMPEDDPAHLSPATRDELVTALAYGLRFGGKAHRQAVDLSAKIAAETLARYLDQAGFVVMKRPSTEPHSTSS